MTTSWFTGTGPFSSHEMLFCHKLFTCGINVQCFPGRQYGKTFQVSTNLFVHFDGLNNQVDNIKVFHQFKILLWIEKELHKLQASNCPLSYVYILLILKDASEMNLGFILRENKCSFACARDQAVDWMWRVNILPSIESDHSAEHAASTSSTSVLCLPIARQMSWRPRSSDTILQLASAKWQNKRKALEN